MPHSSTRTACVVCLLSDGTARVVTLAGRAWVLSHEDAERIAEWMRAQIAAGAPPVYLKRAGRLLSPESAVAMGYRADQRLQVMGALTVPVSLQAAPVYVGEG